MSVRRLAAQSLVLLAALSACVGQTASPGPPKSQLVARLRTLDADGARFQLSGFVSDGGTRQAVSASGHFRRGNVEMTATSGGSTADLALVDGVLYGERPGSNHWLEMNADPATFLWPTTRPSLLWEAMLLSSSTASPIALGRDQVIELAGGLAGSSPDDFARSARGQLVFVTSGARLKSWRVTVDSSGLQVVSLLTVGALDAAEVQAPAGATVGNVLSLFNAPSGALA